MKIYAVTSAASDWLCDSIFLPSVKLCEPNSDVSILRVETGGNGDFQSDEFKKIQRQRLENILIWIRMNIGETILVSDIDIKYLRPFANQMINEIADSQLAFQREALNPKFGINMGQMLIKCSENTLKLFSLVADRYNLASEWEQTILNQELAKTRMKHTLLSPLFSNTKLGFTPGMCSFHTICTAPENGKSSMELKRNQFLQLEKYLAETPR